MTCSYSYDKNDGSDCTYVDVYDKRYRGNDQVFNGANRGGLVHRESVDKGSVDSGYNGRYQEGNRLLYGAHRVNRDPEYNDPNWLLYEAAKRQNSQVVDPLAESIPRLAVEQDSTVFHTNNYTSHGTPRGIYVQSNRTGWSKASGRMPVEPQHPKLPEPNYKFPNLQHRNHQLPMQAYQDSSNYIRRATHQKQTAVQTQALVQQRIVQNGQVIEENTKILQTNSSILDAITECLQSGNINGVSYLIELVEKNVQRLNKNLSRFEEE